jgi:spore germination protein
LTSESAKEKVFEKMQINATRLALVPVGESEEKLCYEFYGKYEDSDYYVYIDAENGRQVEMFKVVKGTEGDFLL